MTSFQLKQLKSSPVRTCVPMSGVPRVTSPRVEPAITPPAMEPYIMAVNDHRSHITFYIALGCTVTFSIKELGPVKNPQLGLFQVGLQTNDSGSPRANATEELALHRDDLFHHQKNHINHKREKRLLARTQLDVNLLSINSFMRC